MQDNIPLKDFILSWNLRFRYDRRWRKKYNISFGSPAHLESNQIDIFIDLMEDRLFKKLEEEYIELRKNEVEFEKTGKFLKEQKLTQEEEDKLYKSLRLSM